MKPHIHPFDEPDLCNNFIWKNPEYIDYFCINFTCHCVLNQVDLDTDLLDNVLLTKDILQPTKNKECRPTHIKIKENNKQKEIMPKNKKFRSLSTQLREDPCGVKISLYRPTESRSGEKNMLQQCLFNTDEDPKNHLSIDIRAFIPITICKFTKNC